MRHLLAILLVLAILLAAAWSVASLLAYNNITVSTRYSAQHFPRLWERSNATLILNPANASYWNQRADLALRYGSSLPPKQRDALVNFNLYKAAALAPSWEVPLLKAANRCSVGHHSVTSSNSEPCRSLYEAVLQRNPTYGYARYRYADFIFNQTTGTPPTKIEQIESLCRQYGRALHLMRLTLRNNSWYQKAQANAYSRCLGLATDYDQARLLKPETDTQWQLMGLGIGREWKIAGWAAAQKTILRDLKEKSANLDQYKALALGLAKGGIPQASDDVIQEYLSIYPSDPKAWLALIDTLRRHKKVFSRPELVEVIIQAQEQAVFTPKQMLSLASYARQAGQMEMALNLFRKAIAADSTNPNAFVNFGNSLLEVGRSKEAIEAYKQAVVIAPNLPDYHVYLGLAYAKDRQYEVAVQEIQRALDLNPHDKKAKAALKKMGVY